MGTFFCTLQDLPIHFTIVFLFHITTEKYWLDQGRSCCLWLDFKVKTLVSHPSCIKKFSLKLYLLLLFKGLEMQILVNKHFLLRLSSVGIKYCFILLCVVLILKLVYCLFNSAEEVLLKRIITAVFSLKNA